MCIRRVCAGLYRPITRTNEGRRFCLCAKYPAARSLLWRDRALAIISFSGLMFSIFMTQQAVNIDAKVAWGGVTGALCGVVSVLVMIDLNGWSSKNT